MMDKHFDRIEDKLEKFSDHMLSRMIEHEKEFMWILAGVVLLGVIIKS